MADAHPPTPDPPTNGGAVSETLALPTTSGANKRQRRPSVRLGDIGEQPPFLRRPKLQTFTKNRTQNPTPLQTLASSSLPKPNRRRRGARSTWTSNHDDDEELRSEFDDLRREDSLSPGENDRARVSEGDAPSESNGGEWGDDEEIGVRPWLNRLGLGRYAPVFEIHEVDEEVLPLLTLEDLKDMGINAVGSRRKMFSAIQKMKR